MVLRSGTFLDKISNLMLSSQAVVLKVFRHSGLVPQPVAMVLLLSWRSAMVSA